jgi:hypothetical protein
MIKSNLIGEETIMKPRRIHANNPGIIGLACFTFSSILFCMPLYGGPFQNLAFEDTDGVQFGIPHWEIPSGIDYLYNDIFAGEGSVTLFDNSFPFFGFLPGIDSTLEGEQSVLMILDPIDEVTGGAIYQDGDIPSDAARLEMLVTDVDGIVVSLDSVVIPLTVIETVAGINRVSGSISDFAGTTARLRISSPFSSPDPQQSAFDAIQFVVPESTTLALVSILLIGITSRRALSFGLR